MPDARKKPNRYAAIIGALFHRHYKTGLTNFEFSREDFAEVAKSLNVELPKNLGDTIYSFRFRSELPDEVSSTAPQGMEWTILLAGRGRYRFALGAINRILPRQDLFSIKIPESTPEIIAAYAMSDEQALLAKVRYNRLIDVFLGITAYSLQNHLRTTVKGIGQIEIDEVYVGVSRSGQQFIVPVQAKGGSDQLGAAQTKQDIAWCAEKFPQLACRAVSAQFMSNDVIAMFELVIEQEEVKVAEEKHYRLVPAHEISAEDLRRYASR